MKRYNVLILMILWSSVNLYSQSAKKDSLEAILKTAKDTSLVNILQKLAKTYEFEDKEKFFEYARQAEILAGKLGYRNGQAKALCSISAYYLSRHEKEKSLAALHQALELSDPKDYSLRAKLFHNLGVTEQDQVLKLAYFEKAIKLAKEINYPQIGFFYRSLGNFYFNQSDFSQSLPYYMKGLEASEKFKDSVSMSLNLDGISSVLEIQDSEKAFAFNMRALKIAEQSGSKVVATLIKKRIVNYYITKGKLDTALTLGYQLLEYAKQTKYQHGVTNSLNVIGGILRKKGENEKAIKYYKMALDLIPEKDSEMEAITSYIGIGAIHNLLHKNAQAIKYLNEGLRIGKLFNSKVEIAEAYFELAQSYKSSSDYKTAYQCYELYHLTNDSIYTLEHGKQIASINAQYELEKKEQSITLLKKDSRIQDLRISRSRTQLILVVGLSLFILIITFLIYNRYRIKVKANKLMEKANLEIRANVKEKEVLLQEIHHRVKNNLQLISSLLKWQGENIENEEMLRIISDGRSRIKSMSLIHESLYQTDNLVYLDVERYLDNLLTYLNKVYNRNNDILLKKNIEPISLDVDIIIPVGLIVNEIVSNAFKYAFPSKKDGRIEVSLHQDEMGHYTLKISDNGVGFPKCLLSEDQSKTMGIHLMKLLVKQIKGRINIYNENGANFIISFGDVSYKMHSLKTYSEYENTNKS